MFKHAALVLSLTFSFANFAMADDAWYSCLMSYRTYCASQGWGSSFYVCDDWNGEDEACVKCGDPDEPDLFAGCGGPGYGKIPANARGPSCPVRKVGHSVIDETGNSYSESLSIVGSDLKLIWSSNRGIGRADDYHFSFPVYNVIPTALLSVSVNVAIAGQSTTYTFSSPTNAVLNYTWNGKDNLGNDLPGGALAKVTLYLDAVGSDPKMTFSVPLGNWRVKALGLGGWSLSNNHHYDRLSEKLYLGDGSIVEADYEDLGSGESAVSLDATSEIYKFDSKGRHVETWAALTGAVIGSFTYDGSGRLTSYTDAYSRTTTFNRTSGVLTGITTPYGVTTSASIDGNGNLSSITTPNSKIYSMTYGLTDMLATFTKPAGEVTTFTVDADGGLSKDEHSGGSFLEYVTTLLANARSYVRTTAMNISSGIEVMHTTSATTSISTDALGVVSKIEQVYGSTGSIEVATNDVRTVTNFTDDPRFGSLASVPEAIVEDSGALTRTSAFTHAVSVSGGDPFDIVALSRTQAVNSRSYSSVYTGSTKTTVSTSPEGRTLTTVMNSYQMPTSVQSGSLTPASFTYNAQGRLWKITQGSRVTEYLYNSGGFVSQITDPLSNSTSYGYDLDGNLTSKTFPDSRIVTFTYDGNGRITGITPDGKPEHGFFYDLMEMLQSYLPPELGGTPRPTEYSYNDDKQLIQMDKPDGGSVYFNYNSTTGKLDSISGLSTLFSYTYETLKGLVATATSYSNLKNSLSYQGNLLAADVTSDATSAAQIAKLELAYDNNFWITSLTVTGNALSTPTTVSFTRDDDGLITGVAGATYTYHSTDPLLSNVAIGNTSEDYTYNSFGELIGKATNYSSTPLYEATYTRDALGRIASFAEDYRGVTNTYSYTYDSSRRLTDVSKDAVAYAHFDYDGNGNRTGGNVGPATITATYDDQDRILTYNNYSFSHNHNGEMTTRFDSRTGFSTTYSYSPLGALSQVVLPNADVIDYLYDGLGRLVGRKKNGVLTDSYIYNGNYQIVADLDGFGNIKSQYIYVTDGHSPDFMIRGGVKYKFIKDHVGSVVLVVNTANGSIAQRVDYDIFGMVTRDSNTCFQPFGFAGGLRDRDTKLVHFGARDYDPETGRWLQKDPILFNGGSVNLFGYAFNDPINRIDPSGMAPPGQRLECGGGLCGGNLRDELASRTDIGINEARIGAAQTGMVTAAVMCGGAAAVAAPYATALCLANPAACTEVGVAAVSGAVGAVTNSTGQPDSSLRTTLAEFLAGLIVNGIRGN